MPGMLLKLNADGVIKDDAQPKYPLSQKLFKLN